MASNKALKLPAPKPYTHSSKHPITNKTSETYVVVVALDDLQEQRGSILQVLCEDLKQVAAVVIVHQNVQALQLRTVSTPSQTHTGR